MWNGRFNFLDGCFPFWTGCGRGHCCRCNRNGLLFGLALTAVSASCSCRCRCRDCGGITDKTFKSENKERVCGDARIFSPYRGYYRK